MSTTSQKETKERKDLDEESMDPTGSNLCCGGDGDLAQLKWINLLAFLLNVGVSYGIGVAGLFGFQTNTEISAKYPTLVTPADYTFSIWGIIFISQAWWVVSQFLIGYLNKKKARNNTQKAIAAVRCNYLSVAVTQASWTATFAQDLIPISTLLILVLFINLFIIVRSLHMQSTNLISPRDAAANNGAKALQRVLVYLTTKFPFVLHLGWVTAASIVAANVLLVNQGVEATIQYWTALGGVVVLVLLCCFLIEKSVVVPLVGAWALVGIDRQLQANDGYPVVFTQTQLDTVGFAAMGAAAMLLAVALVQAYRNYKASSEDNDDDEDESTSYQRVQDGAGRIA